MTFSFLPDMLKGFDGTMLREVQNILGGSLGESVPFKIAAAATLALVAAMFTTFALRAFSRHRLRDSVDDEHELAQSLAKGRLVLDVTSTGPDAELLARCRIQSVSRDRLRCEAAEWRGLERTAPDTPLQCTFRPMRLRGRQVNTFVTRLVDFDSRSPDTGFLLLMPRGFGFTRRRRHVRKRVKDQQFLRIKLWLADPRTSKIPFLDAAPDMAVNAFDERSPGHDANSVINISGGGIGLRVRNDVIPMGCAPDSPVVLNLFLFNFRDRLFKPYWYAGTIRSMEGAGLGFTRLGAAFTHTGSVDDDGQNIRWTAITPNSTGAEK